MAIAMMFFMVVGTVTVVAVGASQTSDRMVERGVQKTQATALAETGVRLLYDDICRDLYTNADASQYLSSRVVKTSFDGATRTQGTYSAKVVDFQTSNVSPAPGFPKGSVEITYLIDLEGLGTSPNGTTSIVRASFTGKQVLTQPTGSTSDEEWKLYPAAIQSNTKVEMVTNESIKTFDELSEDKEAHVIANEGLIWRPESSSKTLFTREDIIDIQGHALVASEPTDMYVQMSRGIAGLGNPNGVKNYRTAPAHSDSNTSYTVHENEVTAMGQKLVFPSWSQVMTLNSTWQSLTKGNASAQKVNPGANGTISVSSLSSKTIVAPAYLSAETLVEAGQTLTLKPSSISDNEKNIIYIDGDLKNLGTIKNLGVTVVVKGEYSDSSSATYKLSQNGSVFPDLQDVYSQSSLISLSPMQEAINMKSDVSTQCGLIYAALGGIKVTGESTMNGMLVSGGVNQGLTYEMMRKYGWFMEDQEGIYKPDPTGGSGSLWSGLGGGVKIMPHGGGEFSLVYIREAAEFSIPGYNLMGSKVLSPFAASNLGNWGQLR